MSYSIYCLPRIEVKSLPSGATKTESKSCEIIAMAFALAEARLDLAWERVSIEV